MELGVFNEAGEQVGTVSFDEKVLGEKVRRKLMHQAVVRYEANKRQGTHKTKTKGERRGAGGKPWKQKHTGRARVGMRRSPLWRGGGVSFGPKPRDYRKAMPVRMRREALKSALLSKFLDAQVKVIDTLDYSEPKTQRMAAALKKLGLDGASCLVTLSQPGPNLVKSVRNLQRCRLLPTRNLNAHDVLKYKNLLFTQETILKIAEVVHA